jgi:hypothetical protein
VYSAPRYRTCRKVPRFRHLFFFNFQNNSDVVPQTQAINPAVRVTPASFRQLRRRCSSKTCLFPHRAATKNHSALADTVTRTSWIPATAFRPKALFRSPSLRPAPSIARSGRSHTSSRDTSGQWRTSRSPGVCSTAKTLPARRARGIRALIARVREVPLSARRESNAERLSERFCAKPAGAVSVLGSSLR